MVEVTQADRNFAAPWIAQSVQSFSERSAYRKEIEAGEHDAHPMVIAAATHRIEAAKAERDRMDAAYLEAFDVHMSLIVTNWPKIKHVPTAIALAAKTMDAMVSFQTLRELPNDVADKAFDLARVELPLMEYRVLRVVATALADALESQP